MNTLLILHELACAVLLWGVFCRFTKSSPRVLLSVRLVFWLLGIAACAAIVAPLMWGDDVHPASLALEWAFVAVQVVTAQHWRNGAPDVFVKPAHKPRARRRSDQWGV